MEQQKASRREFFRARKTPHEDHQLALLRVGRPAMGTKFELIFPTQQRPMIELAHRSLDEVRRLERIMTVYRDDSDLSRVNQKAASEPVPVAD